MTAEITFDEEIEIEPFSGLVKLDVFDQFQTNKVFKQRNDLIKWTREVACGNYRENQASTTRTKRRIRRTSTKRCGCSFSLKAQKANGLDQWKVEILCGFHNHERKLCGLVSTYVLEKIEEQKELAKSYQEDIMVDAQECRHVVRRSLGKPCAHEIVIYVKEEKFLPLSLIHDQWKKLTLGNDDEFSSKELYKDITPELEMIIARYEKSNPHQKIEIKQKLHKIAEPASIQMKEPLGEKDIEASPSTQLRGDDERPSFPEGVGVRVGNDNVSTSFPPGEGGEYTSTSFPRAEGVPEMNSVRDDERDCPSVMIVKWWSMAVPLLEPHCESQTDRHPLLMEHRENHNDREHIIDITRGGNVSSSDSYIDDPPPGVDLPQHEDGPSRSTRTPISQSSLPYSNGSNSRNASFIRRGDAYGRRRRSPLNSGLWISIELVVTVSQIIASIVVLSLSRHEKPKAPLFEWVVGYASGCVATLPLLYWRYCHRNQGTEHDSTQPHQSSSQGNPPPDPSYIFISTIRGSEEEDRRTTDTDTWNGQNFGIPSARRMDILFFYVKLSNLHEWPMLSCTVDLVNEVVFPSRS
ncbi:hypothetical protein HHK36_021556 [Tetracentron sinense]|uniref:Uncharacterized protein n=1 Tax=Tetracentron sinense TaxID=13715 RepID=A0A834YTX8_TETSI|nr:hypothetical protein HHK36_021556 [Tetracentron sinense]